MRRLALAVMTLAGFGLGLAGPALAETTLTVAIPSNLNTLDPAKTKGGEEYIVNFLVYSGLTVIGRDLKVYPDLAESWEASDDLKTWTFHLRKGVKFHHGRELDAEDVVATIERILDKATGSKARTNFLIVDSVKAADKYTVVFKLNTAYGDFAALFGERQARIEPRDKINELAKSPSGTGPFKFVSFSPGDKVVLARNPDYFEAGLPKVDRVVLRIIPESAAQIAALENGEVDLVWNLPLEAIERVKKNPDLVVDSVATATWDGIIMHNGKKPFDDVRVRQAVAAALDKRQLVEIALFGNGSPTHTPIPPSHPYFNKAIPFGPPDVAKAKRLLAEAGYADGFAVTLYVPTGRPTRERLGVAVREFLKPVGIKVDLQRVPWDKFLKDIEGKAAFYTDGFFSRPTVDTSTYSWYHSSGSWNKGLWHYSDPAMDKLLDQARKAKTDAEAKAIYERFQELAVEDSPGIIPYVLNHVNAYNKRVKGFRSHPLLWLDLKGVSVGG